MPIHEFQCQKCQHSFEDLVFGRAMPPCPRCGGKETEKLISRPARRSRRQGSASDFGDFGGDDFGGSGASSCGSCGGGDCSSCGH